MVADWAVEGADGRIFWSVNEISLSDRFFLEVALADQPRAVVERRMDAGEDGLLALAATGGADCCWGKKTACWRSPLLGGGGSLESGRVIGCVEGTAVLNRSQASSYLQKIRVNGASLRITCPGDSSARGRTAARVGRRCRFFAYLRRLCVGPCRFRGGRSRACGLLLLGVRPSRAWPVALAGECWRWAMGWPQRAPD